MVHIVLLLVYESFYKTYIQLGFIMAIFQGFPPQVTYVLGDTVEGIIVRSYIPCSLTLNFLNYVNEVAITAMGHTQKTQTLIVVL